LSYIPCLHLPCFPCTPQVAPSAGSPTTAVLAWLEPACCLSSACPCCRTSRCVSACTLIPCAYHVHCPVQLFFPFASVPHVIAAPARVYYASPHQCSRSGEAENNRAAVSHLYLRTCSVVPLSRSVLAVYPVRLLFPMESRIIARRPSAPLADPRETGDHGAHPVPTQSSASSSLLDPRAQLTMERFLQDLPNAEQPPQEFPPQYHTGRMPNSKAGDGKPRLLLMGQRR
jgi:hypothetical protein